MNIYTFNPLPAAEQEYRLAQVDYEAACTARFGWSYQYRTRKAAALERLKLAEEMLDRARERAA